MAEIIGSGFPRRNAGAAGPDLLTGLVSHFAFEDATPNTSIADSHSSLHFNSGNSGWSSTTGKIDNAITQSAGSNASRAALAAAHGFDNQSFHFVVWLYVRPDMYESIVIRKANGIDIGCFVGGNGDGTYYTELYLTRDAGDLDLFTDGIALTDGTWHMFEFWGEKANNRICTAVDGGSAETLAAAGSWTTTVGVDVALSLVGSANTGGTRYDLLSYYVNTFLDATARAAHYNSGNGLAYASF